MYIIGFVTICVTHTHAYSIHSTGLSLAACYLRPKKRYIFQVVNLTGNWRSVLGTQSVISI